jgi:chorismate dehydratase
MNTPDDIPKLRMAPRETAEELTQRFERETRRVNDQRESELENSLNPFRVGSVSYLNAVPLTRGLEEQIVFLPPSQLAVKLRNNELDAALVSITEVLLHDCYDILNGVAVASLGEVKSVFLAHREPLEKIIEVYCDPASLTSVNLLKVLLAERGINATFKALPDYESASTLPNVLLIGDRGLDFLRAGHPHAIWDLGAAWFEMTQLPFVYAIWALRRDVENARLRRLLREAKDFGLDTLEHIINTRTEYDLEFRKDYLGWHIHYHLGTDEKRGIAKFVDLLRKHDFGPVYDPKFVS